MLDGFRFAEPAALSWLLVVPLLWLAVLAHRWSRRRARRQAGLTGAWSRLSMLAGGGRDLSLAVCVSTAAVLLVCAAARPEARRRQPQYERFDLIVLLDRSSSMLATDVSPSRLARACSEVESFIRTKPEAIDSIALVAFAGTAIVTSHLTTDLDILSFFLDWMKRDSTPFYGTDLAATLERAVTMAARERPERRKVVVLLSDGEDHGERLRNVLAQVRRTGMPVYTIGIGGDTAVPIPAPRGSESPTLLDDDGRVLQARFSESTLRQIAVATNGRYFRAQSGDNLSGILDGLSRRERRVVGYRDEYESLDLFVLGGAVAALGSALVLL